MSEEPTERTEPTENGGRSRKSLMLAAAAGAAVVLAMVVVAGLTAFVVASRESNSNTPAEERAPAQQPKAPTISEPLDGPDFRRAVARARHGIVWLGAPNRNAALRLNRTATNLPRNIVQVGYLTAKQNANFNPKRPVFSVLVSTAILPKGVSFAQAAKRRPPQSAPVRGRGGVLAYLPKTDTEVSAVPFLAPGKGRVLVGQLQFSGPQSRAALKQAIGRIEVLRP